MNKEEIYRIDRITEVIHYLLKGKVPEPIAYENDPDDEIRQLSEKVNDLTHNFREIRDFIIPLSEGRLDIQLPKRNFLASPFKQLQSSLSHLTWQAQQIAKGDFNQRVDFMGDFSQAFNSMVDSLKEARSQLLSEIDRFKQLADLKDHYLHVMAHDIRTPIGAVIGFADILLEEKLNDKERKYVHIIKRNCDSLLALINNILDMAKLEKHKMEIEAVPFSVRTLSEDIEVMIQPKLNKNVRIVLNIDENIPERVIGDPHRLQQVLVNLVGNAAKFTSEGSITFRIQKKEVRSQESEVNSQQPTANQLMLNFSVEDTGIGIAQDKLTDIFTPFVQAESSIASRFGGTGLGLAIAHELVSLMGGVLQVSSQSGKGTIFYFSLPFKIADEISKDEVGDEKLYLKRCNILVVDDNANALEIISHTLKKQNVRFTLCQDSTRVFDLLIKSHEEKRPFTLAWLDIDMPELNGIDLAAKIREEKQLNSLRLIACTSHIEKISDSGSPAYFSFIASKPVSSQALQRIIQEASSGYSAENSGCELAGLRLLVVDDNPLNRFIVKNTMQKLQIDVTEAENGLDGVNKLSEKAFDLVIMDKMMPVMDGIEAIRLIRKAHDMNQLPILAFTADDSPEDKDIMLAAGANGILTKPVEYEKMVESLCQVVNQ